MNEDKCARCGVTLDDYNGYRHHTPDAVRTFQTYCKACMRHRYHAGKILGKHVPGSLLKYKMTPEDVDRMMKAQDARCKICKQIMWPADGPPHVDHDHKTGVVRGLLCRKCNPALHHLLEDPEWLHAALVYLGVWQEYS